MKKILAAMLCAAVTLSCGGNKTEASKEENCQNHSECSQPKEDCTGDCASCDNEKKVNIAHLTKKDFIEKVSDIDNLANWNYKGDKPAIIDFYAEWCGPCKQLAPTLEEIANEEAGKLVIYKVNVEKEPELANTFGVQSIPTLLFVPMNGEPVKSVGFMEKAELLETIKKSLYK